MIFRLIILFAVFFSYETKAQVLTKVNENNLKTTSHNGKLSETHNGDFVLGTKKYNGEYSSFESHELSVPERIDIDITAELVGTILLRWHQSTLPLSDNCITIHS